MNDFDKQLYDLMGTNKIKREEPMKNHTTFRIGGPCEYFITPDSKEEVQALLKLLKDQTYPYFVIGNGSNLLVGDKGFRGAVIQIGKGMDQVTFEENGTVRAGAGIMLAKLATEIMNHSLQGFEFASGIPGTLGGAVFMNAGAYGNEIKDVIIEAVVIDGEGQIRTLTKEELGLSYRNSNVQKNGYIVLEASFLFESGDKDMIAQKMAELNGRRREKQPLNLPSAGSTFKRPEGYFAGKLIQDAGLRGFQIGGAQVSEKHCGFVVNADNATAEDVKELMKAVDQRVYEQFGVHLEPEVRMIGEF